jgi:hypothetical protein
MHAQFSDWRARIPVGAEIFWPQSPLSSWLLLERPNYVSTLQSSGLVFSRATAIEVERRAVALQDFIPAGSILSWNAGGLIQTRSVQQLEGICALALFDFLVTSAKLDWQIVATQPGKSAQDPKTLKLYQCRPQARAAAAAT